MSANRHANGTNALTQGGDRGAALSRAQTPHVSGGMTLLRKMVETGKYIAEDELGKSIRFAVSLRDDGQCSPRDRLRAVEFLQAVTDRGIDVALYLDKCGRLDSGLDTERMGIRLYDRAAPTEDV